MSKPSHTTDEFPRLANAPIVEAVIHWRARSGAEWSVEKLREQVVAHYPYYPEIESFNQLQFAVETKLGAQAGAPVATSQDSWYGFKLTTSDKKDIIQFNRDGIAVSRLAPYEDWDRFNLKAKRAWQAFVDIAEPLEIARLGVRFINRIPSVTASNLSDFLNDPPSHPNDLPLESFLYKSTLSVPNSDLRVHVVKTMQPVATTQSSGLIVDIDVFSTFPIAVDDPMMDERLLEMRSLKNKVFFGLLTTTAIESLK